jgi:hypothetical protein
MSTEQNGAGAQPVTEPVYRVTITAVGEVHDKDGNLVQRIPIEESVDMTQTELDEYINGKQEE